MNTYELPLAANRHTTMSDVAADAGVSLKSVSRVINNEPHVSPKLRLKVEAAIARLDYVPDQAARSLAGARSFEIGLLLGEMGPSYNAQVVAGVYRACIRQQYHLRLDSLPHDAVGDRLISHLERILRGSRCDGFVIVPPYCDQPEVLDLLESRKIAFSRISPSLWLDRSPAVAMDDRSAAAAVADLFWHQGHRRIGLINGRAGHASASLRREGFLTRLQELDSELSVTESAGEFMFDNGIEAGLELLSRPDRPTAIFAVNDDSAAGAMAACNQLGLSVPGDVAICGFDDSWIAKSVWPHLTTVHQPIEQIAEAAAKLLLNHATATAKPAVQVLPHQLIERGSTGPAQ